MKVKVPLFLLLIMAMVAGYVMGTEHGRTQRDVVLVKLGRKDADDTGDTGDAGGAAADAAGDAASDAADASSEAADDAADDATAADPS